jgi:hypothetical protein
MLRSIHRLALGFCLGIFLQFTARSGIHWSWTEPCV